MKNWKRFAYAAIAFVIAALIYTLPDQVSAHKQKRDLEKTFQEYSRAIESRDYSRAYAFGTEPFKEAISQQAFAAQQGSFESQLGRLKSIREEGFYIHGRGSPNEVGRHSGRSSRLRQGKGPLRQRISFRRWTLAALRMQTDRLTAQRQDQQMIPDDFSGREPRSKADSST